MKQPATSDQRSAISSQPEGRMKITFNHDELTDLARGTLLARGFSAADAARFTAKIVCNHKTKPATVSLVLEECGGCPSSLVGTAGPAVRQEAACPHR